MNSLIDLIGYWCVKLFGMFIRALPLNAALWVGRRLGDAARCLIKPKRQKLAYLNLKAAMKQEKSPRELKKIIRHMYQGFGEDFMQVLRIPLADKKYFEEKISIQRYELVEQALARGKGVVFLTAHFGNWEYLNLASAFAGCPIKAVARPQKMQRLDGLLNDFRRQKGCEVIIKDNAVKEIIKGLKENRCVGILGDQGGGASGIFLPFFDRVASTPAGAITLGMKNDSVILPIFCVRKPNGEYDIQVNDPIELPDDLSKAERIAYGIKKYSEILEKYVSEYPHLWLWVHNKWKRTPTKWAVILSDGKAGHFNQSKVVSKQLEQAHRERMKNTKCNFDISDFKDEDIYREIIIEVEYKNKLARGLCLLISVLFPFLLKRIGILKLFVTEKTYKDLSRTYCDAVISCGSSVNCINLFLAAENNAKSIALMNPAPLSYKRFDLIIAPVHDTLPKLSNVVQIHGACTQTTQTDFTQHAEKLKNYIMLKSNKGIAYSRIGILLGGDTKKTQMSKQNVTRLVAGVKEAVGRLHADIFLTTSRRTPAEIDKIIEDEFSGYDACRLLIIANKNNRQNVVSQIIGISSVVVVSSDSVSMICEAASSGRTVIVVGLEQEDIAGSTRHDIFLHEYMDKEGYIILASADKLKDVLVDVIKNNRKTRLLDNNKILSERLKKFEL